ncbi:MAG: hypothetical protein K8T20_17665, partial [Planctomycetes bacterium]|nr:hypothetical protein [Planctomycetota bacterium]
MKKLAIASALFVCAAALAEDKAPPPPRKIDGVTLDTGNVLQAEAELAIQWSWEAGKAVAVSGIASDAKGHFEHTFKKWPGSVLVLAYDKDREHGCLFNITDELSKKPL